MTLSELLSVTRVYLDDQSMDRFSDAALIQFLNIGQSHAISMIAEKDESYFSGCREYQVTALENSSLEFDLPADFLHVIQAERLGSASPIPVDWVNFRDRHERDLGHAARLFGDELVSRPRCYLRGGKIGVVAPDASFTLRLFYDREPPSLRDPDDVSELPTRFHNAIALHAARLAAPSEDTTWRYEPQYQEAMADIERYANTRQRQEPGYVRDFGE